MKLFLLAFFISTSILAGAQDGSGKTFRPASEYQHVYMLPYEAGKSHLLIQGYQSHFSHKGEFALDFMMRKKTKITAARAGTVVEVKEDSKIGGVKKKYLNEGNHIIIRHEDGTYGNYWHLSFEGALVKPGDKVEVGQVIGLSGSTGFSAFPHLHFEVTTQFTPGRNQIPTPFLTRKGPRFLKPLRWYKSILFF